MWYPKHSSIPACRSEKQPANFAFLVPVLPVVVIFLDYVGRQLVCTLAHLASYNKKLLAWQEKSTTPGQPEGTYLEPCVIDSSSKEFSIIFNWIMSQTKPLLLTALEEE